MGREEAVGFGPRALVDGFAVDDFEAFVRREVVGEEDQVVAGPTGRGGDEAIDSNLSDRFADVLRDRIIALAIAVKIDAEIRKTCARKAKRSRCCRRQPRDLQQGYGRQRVQQHEIGADFRQGAGAFEAGVKDGGLAARALGRRPTAAADGGSQGIGRYGRHAKGFASERFGWQRFDRAIQGSGRSHRSPISVSCSERKDLRSLTVKLPNVVLQINRGHEPLAKLRERRGLLEFWVIFQRPRPISGRFLVC